MAIISKGITLSYGSPEADKTLTNLQEVPDLGGAAEAVEITTLADAAHMYMDGLLDYGDSLEFKFLHEKEQFLALSAVKESQQWKVTLPDTMSCTFSGTCSVKLDSVGVGSPLTYTLAIKPNSEMVFA